MPTTSYAAAGDAYGLRSGIGGLAVGSGFTIDHRLGIVSWLAAATHEVPQELGDFVCIPLTDLLPEITTSPTAREKGVLTTGFAAGLLLLSCATPVFN